VLEASLKGLGIPYTRTENVLVDHAVNILLGACVFAVDHLLRSTQGRSYVIYQMEPLSSAHGFLSAYPKYLELLRKATRVWEYSKSNLAYLEAMGVHQVDYVPPVHHEVMEVLNQNCEKDIDIVFSGAISPRRQKILDQLRRHGLRVEACFGVYGSARNQIIERAKILINIHQHEGLSVLEEVRLSFLLANRGFVISELSDWNPYGDGVVYCAYEELVGTCLKFLAESESVRDAIAAQGVFAARQRSMMDFLKPAWEHLQDIAES
jgi:hypothetical protein